MSDKKIRRYYRQIMFGNRNTLARSLDFIALRVIVYIAFLLWFSLQTSNITLSYVLSAIATGMVSVALALYKNIRLDRFVESQRRELSRNYMLEQMVLMPRRDFVRLMAAFAKHSGYKVEQMQPRGVLCHDEDSNTIMLFAIQNHPKDAVTSQQMLECFRFLRQNDLEKGVLLCTAPLSEGAESLLSKLPEQPFAIWDQDKLLHLANDLDLLPDAKEVEEGILIELESRRMHLKQLKKQAIGATRVRSYITCGLILFFAAIITGQHLYYPIMGAICFFMAFLSYFNEHNHRVTQ